MNNLPALMQLLKSGNNPQGVLTNIVQQQAHSNPMMANLLNMMNNNDTKGIEQLARNLAKEKHIDIDSMAKQIKF